MLIEATLLTLGGGTILGLGALSASERRSKVISGGASCGDEFLDGIKRRGQELGCPVLDFADENNRRMINSIGILMDSLGQKHSTSGLSIVMYNVLGNMIYTALQIIFILFLIVYTIKWVIDTIKAKLDKIDGATDLITKIWNILKDVIKVTIDSIKAAIDGIRNAIEWVKRQIEKIF